MSDADHDAICDYWAHYLRRLPGAVYAVLDGARDPRVRRLGDDSLYDGAERDALADVAPYLVRLDGERLARVVGAGWGRAWGVFLISRAGERAVRAHLQTLLEVESEYGEHYGFRFYDPRVLRAFGRACTRDELDELCGPIERFVVEAREPSGAWELAAGGVRAVGVHPC